LARYNYYFDRSLGRLPNGTLKILVEETGVCERTIQQIALEYRTSVEENGIYHRWENNRVGNCGAKSTLTDSMRDAIVATNFLSNGELSIREMTRQVGAKSKSTVHRWCDTMGVDRVSSYCMPMLTEDHRFNRLSFVLS